MKYRVTATTTDGSLWVSHPLSEEELDEDSESILDAMHAGDGLISIPAGDEGHYVRVEHIVALTVEEVPE